MLLSTPKADMLCWRNFSANADELLILDLTDCLSRQSLEKIEDFQSFFLGDERIK